MSPRLRTWFRDRLADRRRWLDFTLMCGYLALAVLAVAGYVTPARIVCGALLLILLFRQPVYSAKDDHDRH